MYDLKITGGTIVDGTGAPRFGDIGVKDGDRRRRRRGADDSRARPPRPSTPPARSSRPGFVDIHTHYDGQVTWDERARAVERPRRHHPRQRQLRRRLRPRAPGREDWLIELMEGVEDIPGTALHRGHDVGLGELPRATSTSSRAALAVDFGVQIAHGAVRAYVMGERGARNEPASPEDIDLDGPARHRGRSRPARSASPPRAPSATGPWTASRCPAPSPPRTSCSASAGPWRPAAGRCSSWPAGRRRRGHRRAQDRGRVDAAPGRRGRPARVVRPDPGRRRPRPVARDHGRVAGRPRGRRPDLPAGRRPALRHAARLRRATTPSPSGPPTSSWRPSCTPEELAARAAEPGGARPPSSPRATCPPDPNVLFDGMNPLAQGMVDRTYSLGDPPDYEPTPDRTVAADRRGSGAATRSRCSTTYARARRRAPC